MCGAYLLKLAQVFIVEHRLMMIEANRIVEKLNNHVSKMTETLTEITQFFLYEILIQTVKGGDHS
jgi:hypothetical protein